MRTPTLVVVAAALTLAACGQGSQPSSSDVSVPATSPGVAAPATPGGADTAKPGVYLTAAEYEGRRSEREGTTVVLFFHAPWCPSCRATEDSLRADGVPAGLTVVKVDFDTATDLRRQYGVTVQHTFVQVDPSGRRLAAFTGALTGAEIASRTG